MSARNCTGVLRYSSMMRWNSTRFPPACVWIGTLSSRAASLPARRSGSLHVSTWAAFSMPRSEEHTSELQSPYDLVCRLLLEKKKKKNITKKSKPLNTKTNQSIQKHYTHHLTR